MRRTKAAQIYKTRKFTAVQLLLGHTKLESTLRYLGIGLMTRSAFRSKLSCEPRRKRSRPCPCPKRRRARRDVSALCLFLASTKPLFTITAANQRG